MDRQLDADGGRRPRPASSAARRAARHSGSSCTARHAARRRRAGARRPRRRLGPRRRPRGRRRRRRARAPPWPRRWASTVGARRRRGRPTARPPTRTSTPSASAPSTAARCTGLVQPGWDQARVARRRAHRRGRRRQYEGTQRADPAQGPRHRPRRAWARRRRRARPGPRGARLHRPEPRRATPSSSCAQDRLVGAILLGVGDAAGALTQLYDTGAAAPAGSPGAHARSRRDPLRGPDTANLAEMPGNAVICRCNTVTKSAVVRAFRGGADTVAGVAEATRATTGCGSCTGAVDGLCSWLRSSEPQPDPTPVARLTCARPPDTGVGTRRTDRRSRLMSSTSENHAPPASSSSATAWSATASSRRCASRDTDEPRGGSSCSARSRTPAYDRVGLSSSYVGAWDRGACALPGNEYAGDRLRRPAARHRAPSASTATRAPSRTSARRASSRTTRSCSPPAPYPFVPPVPGHDLPTAASSTARSTTSTASGRRRGGDARRRRARAGVVVGGGLLGLEAANALRLLGLTPHVVEFAPRLMPLQVDEGGGALLAPPHRASSGVHGAHRRGHELGRHRGRRPACARRALRRHRPARRDAGRLLRRRAAARRSWPATAGLDVGQRGGVVDRRRVPHVATRTSGRSASAPPSRAAATASSRPATRWPRSSPTGCSAARRRSPAPTCRPSSSCSASTSPASATRTARHRARSRSSSTTPSKGTYAKLVVSDDAQTLLGGILVGDASRVRARCGRCVGRELPGDPVR